MLFVTIIFDSASALSSDSSPMAADDAADLRGLPALSAMLCQ
jgi:hypothetical protein